MFTNVVAISTSLFSVFFFIKPCFKLHFILLQWHQFYHDCYQFYILDYQCTSERVVIGREKAVGYMI